MGKEKLLSLSEIFFIIWVGESRRSVTLDTQTTEGSIMISIRTTKDGTKGITQDMVIKLRTKGQNSLSLLTERDFGALIAKNPIT